MNPYIPILGMFALATIFVLVAMGLSNVIGPKRYNRTKHDSFECGLQGTPQPTDGGRFSVKYYLTAMLFIMFDIELVFLYPWAVHFNQLNALAIGAMIVFIVTIFVAYFYELRRGGLDWD